MTYHLVEEFRVLRALRRLSEQDPAGTAHLVAAIGRLAEEPRPPEATELGTSGWFRLRVGDYRVMYEVDEVRHMVHIDSVGQAPPPRSRTGR